MRTWSRVLASTLICCVLLACAKAQLEHQADSFNRAISQSGLEQLLLNVVRTSKDEPVSFTKLVKYTSENMLKGSVSPKFPFGPDAMSAFDFSPVINVSTGTNTIEYGDVNTQEALVSLNQQVTFGVFNKYIGTGRLAQTLLVSSFEIHETLYSALLRQYAASCGRDPNQFRCREIRKIEEECKIDWGAASLLPFTGGKYAVFGNSAATRCDFLAFQGVLAMLSISGFVTDARLVPHIVTEGKEKMVVKESIAVVNFTASITKEAFDEVKKGLARRKITDEHALNIVLRSPKQMIEYLGDIVALENYASEHYTPMVRLGSDAVVPFFLVHRSNGVTADTVLSVQDRHGDTFVVPRPEYGSTSRDLTLRVLSIVNELVNAGISTKALPPATSVIVRGVD